MTVYVLVKYPVGESGVTVVAVTEVKSVADAWEKHDDTAEDAGHYCYNTVQIPLNDLSGIESDKREVAAV